MENREKAESWTGDTDTLVSNSYPEPVYNSNKLASSSDFASLLASDTGFGNIMLSSPEDSKTPIFYITNSQWRPGKPSVTISFRTKDGPILGVLKLGWGSENVFGLGDPATDDIKWEGLTKVSKWTHGKYEFEFRGRRFMWQRTRQSVFGDQPDLELTGTLPGQDVAAGQGEVLAVYKSRRELSWRKRGTFYVRRELFNGLGGGTLVNGVEKESNEWGDWELAALLTCLGILEGARRRTRQRRLSNGGGA